MAELTGRCACGAVTWQSDGPVLWAGICHCESCRRANSAPMVPFFGVPRAGLNVEGPVQFRESSNGVERGFCSDCASPMFYRNAIWPEESHIMAATLDDPAAFKPEAHYHWAERLDWVRVADELPKYPGSAENTLPVDE